MTHPIDLNISSPVRVPAPPTRRASVWHYARPALALSIIVVILTGVIGQRFYNQPRLAVGRVAPITLRARHDAHIEDVESTEAKRKEARLATAPVLMANTTANQEIYQTLQRLIDQGNLLRSHASPLPFVNPSILSTPSQVYLQQAEEWEWRSILRAVQDIPLSLRHSALSPDPWPSSASRSPLTASTDTPAQQRATAELRVFQRTASAAEFDRLVNQVNQARRQYATALAAIQEEATAGGSATPAPQGSPLYDATLLALTPDEWQATQLALRQVTRRMTTQGIPPGLPNQFLREAASYNFKTCCPQLPNPWPHAC